MTLSLIKYLNLKTCFHLLMLIYARVLIFMHIMSLMNCVESYNSCYEFTFYDFTTLVMHEFYLFSFPILECFAMQLHFSL